MDTFIGNTGTLTVTVAPKGYIAATAVESRQSTAPIPKLLSSIESFPHALKLAE